MAVVRATITSKGQVTIPAELRRRLGIETGDVIEFIEDEDGFRVRKCLAEDPWASYVGYLSHLGYKSTDDLMRDLRGEEYGTDDYGR